MNKAVTCKVWTCACPRKVRNQSVESKRVKEREICAEIPRSGHQSHWNPSLVSFSKQKIHSIFPSSAPKEGPPEWNNFGSDGTSQPDHSTPPSQPIRGVSCHGIALRLGSYPSCPRLRLWRPERRGFALAVSFEWLFALSIACRQSSGNVRRQILVRCLRYTAYASTSPSGAISSVRKLSGARVSP